MVITLYCCHIYLYRESHTQKTKKKPKFKYIDLRRLETLYIELLIKTPKYRQCMTFKCFSKCLTKFSFRILGARSLENI